MAICRLYDIQVVFWDELDTEDVTLITARKFAYIRASDALLMRPPHTVHIAWSGEKNAHVEAYVFQK